MAPPIFRNRGDCLPCFNVSIDRNNSAVVGTDNYHDEDKHALLYIVCTLLFYSLGMIVGIVSYIKREKQDIQQDRMFNEFLTSFRGKTEELHYRQLKVQETVERLAEIDRVGGLGNKSFSAFNSHKTSSAGISLVENNCFEFASRSVLPASFVVGSSMTSEEGSHKSENVMEGTEPFQDRRLSELVAQMLDTESEELIKETIRDNDDSNDEINIETALIDYSREPRNKELHRETMQSIEENDSENALAAENSSAVKSKEVLQTKHKRKSDFVQDNASSHNIKTTVGKSIETVFGVTVPQENTRIEVEKKLSNETEFGSDTEHDDTKFRWSVTSV